MTKHISTLALAALVTLSGATIRADNAKPNILVILADDLGYGDIGCYGATKVKTPHIDKLAADGLRFLDAHAPSSTCTPTRYALLTGEYAWRKKGTGVLPGDASLIIDPARPTLPSVMKSAGYTTGCIGKWHLGLGNGDVDWNTEVKPGPNQLGFDYSFIMPATGDRVPCVYLENGRVVGLDTNDPIHVSYNKLIGNEPTGRQHPEMLKMKLSLGHDGTIVDGISRIGFMSGGKSALWKDTDLADTLAKKAIGFVEQNKDHPFFLYLATHDIHVPRVPHQRFQGTSQCGVRGDVIQQLDGAVGDVLAALDRLKLSDNTIVIFTSDNGPVVDDGYADGAARDLNGHKPAGVLRGGKYSIYEGGTRVPFIVRWPGHVKSGTTSDALVCLVDFMASFAALTGVSVPANGGPDSLNTMPAFLGDSKTGRETLVEHSGGIALREGAWKFIPGGKVKKNANPEAHEQLYDLAKDPGENKNVIGKHADQAAKMAATLEEIRAKGGSRP